MIKKCKRQVPSNKESKQGMEQFETGGMVEKRVRSSVKSKETSVAILCKLRIGSQERREMRILLVRLGFECRDRVSRLFVRA